MSHDQRHQKCSMTTKISKIHPSKIKINKSKRNDFINVSIPSQTNQSASWTWMSSFIAFVFSVTSAVTAFRWGSWVWLRSWSASTPVITIPTTISLVVSIAIVSITTVVSVSVASKIMWQYTCHICRNDPDRLFSSRIDLCFFFCPDHHCMIFFCPCFMDINVRSDPFSCSRNILRFVCLVV